MRLRLAPAPAEHGIRFVRTDVGVEIPATLAHIGSQDHATTLSRDGVSIGTVEHLLAALAGLGIDDVRVEVDGPEVPVLDGSAPPFVILLHEAGLRPLAVPRLYLRVKDVVEVVHGAKSARLVPSEHFVYTGAHHVSVVESDFDELMSVGSTSDVAGYVLVDRWHGPANLFKVKGGSMDEMTDSPLNGKEINMGDQATLRSFVNFASSKNPADHKLLIFWNHGSPRGVAWDDHASDAGGEDFLSHWEFTQAIAGLKVDVIGADECNVGQVEVAYQYAVNTQTEFLVAAQTYTGWRGFPYDWTLEEMTNDPDMTPREAAIMMIEETQRLLDPSPEQGEKHRRPLFPSCKECTISTKDRKNPRQDHRGIEDGCRGLVDKRFRGAG